MGERSDESVQYVCDERRDAVTHLTYPKFSELTKEEELLCSFDNPYLEEAQKVPSRFDNKTGVDHRGELVKKYSWAIPNELALRSIADFSPIIDVGSGNGYWAYLLEKEFDVEVVCYDDYSGKINNPWIPPVRGSYESIEDFLSFTLFLGWPPYNTPLAYNCLQTYKGRFILYVGEGWGGCTGDDAFHELLNKEFNSVQEVSIPQWWGIHDFLMIYERK